MDILYFIALALLLFALILLGKLAVYDFKHMRLPNIYTYPLALAGLFFHACLNFAILPPLDVILGGVAGFSILYLVRIISAKMYGREALGMGDVKLFGAAGLWLGMLGFSYALALGALCVVLHGLIHATIVKVKTGVWKLRKLKIPAGPGFIVGITIVILLYIPLFLR